MESQGPIESLFVSKMDLDLNMNNTAPVIGKENLAQHKDVDLSADINTANTQHESEQTTETVQPGTQIPTKTEGNTAENVLNSAPEQTTYTATSENVTLNDNEVNQHTADETSVDSIDKTANTPSKTMSILAAELMSDSSHLIPSVAFNRSATTSPTGSNKGSPEVTSSNKPSGSSKGKVKQRRRGSAWTDEETDFLMEVWAQQSELMKNKGGDESVTCAPVYRLISRSMAELGYDKSWEQCKTRIHTLKRAYKITKDEIDNGAETVTYCRHFDKLEIISGDNPQISPGLLAAELEKERKERDVRGISGKKQPVKRKLTVGENPNLVKKRSNNCNPVIPTTGIIPKLLAQVSPQSSSSTGQVQTSSCTAMNWYPPTPTQHQQQQQQPLQPQQQFLTPISSSVQPSTPANNLSITPPQVQQTSAYSYPPQVVREVTPPPPYSSANVANVQMSVKPEGDDMNTGSNQFNLMPAPTNWQTTPINTLKIEPVPSAPSAVNDIERMRLDLEMRKLEVERNKIEMEERQRREDRDHQYRMMQLLMFGLGQQNGSQLLSGHTADIAHTSTEILRALENGIVPGWSQKVNEKGLSFSEL